MNRLRAFGAFLYDFVVGDDPMICAVIVVALALTALIADGGIAAWWLMPVAVVGALAYSVLRASRGALPATASRRAEDGSHQSTRGPQDP